MSALFCLFLCFRSYLEVYILIFYKTIYILEELFVAFIWIISQLIIYIDQLNTGRILLFSRNKWSVVWLFRSILIAPLQQGLYFSYKLFWRVHMKSSLKFTSRPCYKFNFKQLICFWGLKLMSKNAHFCIFKYNIKTKDQGAQPQDGCCLTRRSQYSVELWRKPYNTTF